MSPDVIQGSIVLTPEIAQRIAQAITPTVELGPVTVTPEGAQRSITARDGCPVLLQALGGVAGRIRAGIYTVRSVPVRGIFRTVNRQHGESQLPSRVQSPGYGYGKSRKEKVRAAPGWNRL